METDIEELRSGFLNEEFDEVTFDIDGQRFAEYALSCGEQAPRFTDPAHDDFQAPPTLYQRSLGAARCRSIFRGWGVSAWMREKGLSGWLLFGQG